MKTYHITARANNMLRCVVEAENDRDAVLAAESENQDWDLISMELEVVDATEITATA